MQLPVEVTVRGVSVGPALRALVRRQALKLERYCGGVVGCRVAIERPQRHQRSGSPFRVRIDMTVPPGREILVRRESGEGDMHAVLRTVVLDAFRAARRRLTRVAQQRRPWRRPARRLPPDG